MKLTVYDRPARVPCPHPRQNTPSISAAAVSTNPKISSPARAKAQSIEELALKSGIASETVVLSGDELVTPERTRSHSVRQRIRLRNRATGTETIIRIFRDGYLSATQRRRGKAGRERTIDLRFVDPSPKLSRFIARTPFRLMLACLSVLGIGGLLAYFSILPLFSWSLVGVALLATTVAATIYVHRRREVIEFRTIHGRVVAFALVANLGSLRAHRRAVPKIVTAIREAHALNDPNKQLRLREEMREHYRMARAGLISDEACAAATRNILERF